MEVVELICESGFAWELAIYLYLVTLGSDSEDEYEKRSSY